MYPCICVRVRLVNSFAPPRVRPPTLLAFEMCGAYPLHVSDAFPVLLHSGVVQHHVLRPALYAHRRLHILRPAFATYGANRRLAHKYI